MGNAWLDFLAEERGKDENKDVPPMELSSHVRPKYDAWKMDNGIESKMEENKMEENKMEENKMEVVVVKKRRSFKKGRKGKSNKKKGKKARKSRKTRKHYTFAY